MRSAYRRLEQDPPEAFAAFREYLVAEQQRAERFVAPLSLRRRAEHLAAFDSDEYRLEPIGRWLGTRPYTTTSESADEPVSPVDGV